MGTNKSTCPMNPAASHPNALVHRLAQQPIAQQPIATDRYYIHENGGTPFVVDNYKNQKKVIIYSYIDFPPTSTIEQAIADGTLTMKKINEISYIKIFTKNPHCTYDDGYDLDTEGSTILLQTGKNTYVLISNCVAEFKTIKGDQIVTFVSPIGNSDVPYPYAIGKKYTYLLIFGNYADNKKVPKKVLKLEQDPYELVVNGDVLGTWKDFKFKLINYANYEEGPAGRYSVNPDLYLA